MILFFATYSAAFMATVPPGLLNMNAAKTSVERGKRFGVVFSFGVSTVIMLQAYVAVLISKFLNNNPQVVSYLLYAALVIFAFLAVYFYLVARRPKRPAVEKAKEISKKNSFYKGGLLASLNLLTIPYYAGLNAMWNASGWIEFLWQDTLTFVLAAGLGTFSVLYLYVFYFNKLEFKNGSFSKKANYILCVLMVILFVITLIRLLRHGG